MLCSLSIHNIALIDQVSIDFADKLNVLTGETGAGKSIILDALGLALGQRSEARLLRAGTKQGSVTAEFAIAELPAINAMLEEQGLPAEDALLLRRVLYSDGRTKAYANDAPISVTLLRELGSQLVEIHGQHDQKGLLSPTHHRQMLDLFTGHALSDTAEAYRHWQEAVSELESVKASLASAHGESAYLEHAVDELRKLAPTPGEEEELADLRRQLMQRESIIETLQSAMQYLQGQSPISEQIYNAQRLFFKSGDALGDTSPITDALERASIEIGEAQQAIEHKLMEMEANEHSVETIEERLFALRGASRKYQCPADELPELQAELEGKLKLLAEQETRLQELEHHITQAKQSYIQQAERVRAAREKAATQLATQLTEALQPLKMGQTTLTVEIEAQPEERWAEHGMDKVTFLVSTNPGNPPGPMHKIASGGELSRFMLALKTVLSSASTPVTMIFDEVDTGIGGAVADAVGKHLHDVAHQAQVLVVTHQPQVAAYGNHHLRVEKLVENETTLTRVHPLLDSDKQEEIARMLAGENITEEARAAARKLLHV